MNQLNKRTRQYVGLLAAVVAYYLIHEGAHLLYALWVGAFKRVNFMSLGVQVDIYAEKLSPRQLGVFCLLGSVATLLFAYILIALIRKISKLSSKTLKACTYYITLALMLIDPLYLSALCGFFGGGDMNGISLIIPQALARILYGVILVINLIIFIKIVLPRYKSAFANNTQ